MPNEHENFQNAILNYKARIEEINRAVAQAPPRASTRRIIQERLHLEQKVAELEKEDARLQRLAAVQNFSWESLNHALIDAKCRKLSEEMQDLIPQDKRAIEAEALRNGNGAYYLPAFFRMQEKRAKEWALRAKEIYCEVARLQGLHTGPSFMRAVLEKAILPVLAARKGSAEYDATLRAQRIGKSHDPQLAAAIGQWHRSVQRLLTSLRNELEIEGMESVYNAHETAPKPDSHNGPVGQLGAGTSADNWRDLRKEFEQLRDEEVIADPGNRRDKWLRALVSDVNGENEFASLLSGGINDSFKFRFEDLAKRAGLTLDPGHQKPIELWIYQLFTELHKRRSELVRGTVNTGVIHGVQQPATRGGWIPSICEASVAYCSVLALASPESDGGALLPPLRATKRMRPKTRLEMKRQRVIFGAIQAGYTGLKYCRELDTKRLKPPQAWTEQDCPRTYEAAYKLDKGPWRKRIQDEKCRHRTTYDATSHKEREQIIQGSSRSTRSTRA